MTSPVVGHSHGQHPRPSWRSSQDARFQSYARVQTRRDRVGDRNHVLRAAQPSSRRTCMNEVIAIDLGRTLTRREHMMLTKALIGANGVTVVNIQGEHLFCVVNLNKVPADDRPGYPDMIADWIQELSTPSIIS